MSSTVTYQNSLRLEGTRHFPTKRGRLLGGTVDDAAFSLLIACATGVAVTSTPSLVHGVTPVTEHSASRRAGIQCTYRHAMEKVGAHTETVIQVVADTYMTCNVKLNTPKLLLYSVGINRGTRLFVVVFEVTP